MKQSITIAADDFGLTKGITDTMLETVDKGPVTLVSILMNGEAVDYAIEEYKKRSSTLALAVHLNLTEGKALSVPARVPHLVDAQGFFTHSVLGLWLRYLRAPSELRKELRYEVRLEMEAQLHAACTRSGLFSISVNGHQHVHLIPFVFEELACITYIASVRTVREPFYFSGIPTLRNVCAHFILDIFSKRARICAAQHNIPTNDWFVGFLYSGRMNAPRMRKGIAHTGRGSVEVLFHPGSAENGELASWEKAYADTAWHFSSRRSQEREALKCL